MFRGIFKSMVTLLTLALSIGSWGCSSQSPVSPDSNYSSLDKRAAHDNRVEFVGLIEFIDVESRAIAFAGMPERMIVSRQAAIITDNTTTANPSSSLKGLKVGDYLSVSGTLVDRETIELTRLIVVSADRYSRQFERGDNE